MAFALDDPKVQSVLTREHERSKGDSAKLADRRAEIDAAKQAGTFTYDLFPNDVYLCIEPAMGRFLNLCIHTIAAKSIVEFGTSFGVSTIYLAAAARDTGGRVVSTELEPSKAEKARANLEEAGLADVVDIRVGDAMETLRDFETEIELLFLDGWKDVYLPLAKMLMPKLAANALMLADNIHTFEAELQDYVDFVSEPGGPFRSVTLPFESGLQYTVYTGS